MSALSLAYEQYGDQSNEPLIIIHGFFASARNWRQIAKQLAQHFNVYVVDMRNHGQSPHHAEMDYSVMADDLFGFLDQQQLAIAHLLGHSMGGKIAMWFAILYPDRVNKLIVADISPVNYQHSFDGTINALQSIPLEQISNRKQAEEALIDRIPEQSYRLFLLQNLQLVDGKYCWRINLDIFLNTANNIVGFPALGNYSANFSQVLFLMGGVSSYLDEPAIYHYFPNATISVLDGASHWLHVDKPKQFLTNVTDFIHS